MVMMLDPVLCCSPTLPVINSDCYYSESGLRELKCFHYVCYYFDIFNIIIIEGEDFVDTVNISGENRTVLICALGY